MKEKISVIIPTYNRGTLIKRSIESVLEQTYSNLEVLVVDDCSSDNTEEIIKNIKDKRIKYIKLKKNMGAPHARNIGVQNATGIYIAFQDSDDVFRKDKLEKQLKNMKKEEADFDFCKIGVHIDDKIYDLPSEEQDEIFKNHTFLQELCKGNFISTQAIILKKEILQDISFDESLPRFQDYDFVLKVAKKHKISYTKEILVDIYRQEDSISHSDEKLKKACSIMLNKDYGFNKKLTSTLQRTLFYWGSKEETDKRIEEIEKKHQKELQNAVKEENKFKKKYQDLLYNYENLVKEKQEKDAELDKILYSRRWIYTSKVVNVFKKKRG